MLKILSYATRGSRAKKMGGLKGFEGETHMVEGGLLLGQILTKAVISF